MILKAIKYFLKMKAKGVDVISIFRIKGHRIRASDKHLVYHFSIGTILFVFVAVLLLLNIKQLMRTDWEHFSLLENGLTLSPYNFITILIATGVCAFGRFSVLPLLLRQFQEAPAPSKIGKNDTGK